MLTMKKITLAAQTNKKVFIPSNSRKYAEVSQTPYKMKISTIKNNQMKIQKKNRHMLEMINNMCPQLL